MAHCTIWWGNLSSLDEVSLFLLALTTNRVIKHMIWKATKNTTALIKRFQSTLLQRCKQNYTNYPSVKASVTAKSANPGMVYVSIIDEIVKLRMKSIPFSEKRFLNQKINNGRCLVCMWIIMWRTRLPWQHFYANLSFFFLFFLSRNLFCQRKKNFIFVRYFILLKSMDCRSVEIVGIIYDWRDSICDWRHSKSQLYPLDISILMPQLFGLKTEQYICYSYFSKTRTVGSNKSNVFGIPLLVDIIFRTMRLIYSNFRRSNHFVTIFLESFEYQSI